MATLRLDLVGTMLWYEIRDLQSPFNPTYYQYAGIALRQFMDGQFLRPEDTIHSVNSTAGNMLYFASSAVNVGHFATGTYTLYGWAQAANGAYYRADTASFTVGSVGPARPSDWNWAFPNSALNGNNYGYLSGEPLYMAASEWNSFCSRVNEFRQYKGLMNYPFTAVSANAEMLAVRVNQAVDAINVIPGSLALSSVSAGSNISPWFFYNLRLSLNNVT